MVTPQAVGNEDRRQGLEHVLHLAVLDQQLLLLQVSSKVVAAGPE